MIRRAASFVLFLAVGCAEPHRDDVSLATRPYPIGSGTPETIDVQVVRDDVMIDLVNGTQQSWRDATVWINRRYMAPLQSLPAGATRRMNLWTFRDAWGSVFYAGGFFRSREPMDVRLVELQASPDAPLLGLITVAPPRED